MRFWMAAAASLIVVTAPHGGAKATDDLAVMELQDEVRKLRSELLDLTLALSTLKSEVKKLQQAERQRHSKESALEQEESIRRILDP